MQKMVKGKFDFSIFLITIILALFGCVMVYSASYYRATIKLGQPAYYFIKQVEGVVLGLLAMLFMANFNFQRLERVKVPLVVVTLVLLLCVFLPKPIGIELNGARRWVNLGITTMQPSELCKITVVVLLSSYFAKNRERLSTWTGGVIPAFVISAVMCIPIMLQPNLSMVLCIMIITFIMLFACGASKTHLLILCVLGVAAVAVLIIIEPYRLKRMFVYLDPWSDTQGDSWQLIQSFYAIGSGGLFGKGLGMSQQKLLFLPMEESDFIFSIIAEELGLVGVFCVIAAYLFLIWRGMRVALTCPNAFGSNLAMGITTMIAVQVAINIGVVTGSIPPTGQTLPFISAGTSSLMLFMGSIGILLNISRYSTPA